MNRASRPTETVEEIKSAFRVLREVRESLVSEYDRRLMTTAISVLTDATAVAGEPQAATQGEPVYQIQRAFPGDPLNTWRDATEEAYNLHMPDYRRILYAQAGKPQDRAQGEGKQQGEATKFKHWCETCEGLGYYDSTLGCDSRLGNRKQECPDCDGRGYWEARGGDEGMVQWPTMPPSKGQSHILFEDGYAEGWAKCLDACREAVLGAVDGRKQP